VVGNITDRWALIGGVAWSDNEQTQGTTGTNATGAAARWAPDYSANLWTTYTVGKWSAGLGVNYVDEQKLITDPNNPNATSGLGSIPSATVFNGMASYAVTDSLGLQLNVYNLFDKDYITSLNNGGSRIRLGTPRYAQLTATFKF
jgi:catecholate siderophore receptor